MNKAIIVGRLGKYPGARLTSSGKEVCDFSLATSERYKDNSGQQQERTEWHSIVVWGSQAGPCGRYLKKGSMAAVDGKIQTRSWDKDGQKQYRTEIVAQRVEFLDSKKDGQQLSGQQSNNNSPAEDDLPF